MNHRKVKSAISRYISSGNNLAIQIDGKWGTGKTYFVEHTVIPYLKSKNKFPVYISLNGVKSLNDVKRLLSIAIIQSKFGKKTELTLFTLSHLVNSGIEVFAPKIFTKFKNKAINNISVYKYLSTLASQYYNVVLIFDDFERNELDTQEIMGFLANILNKFQCKMIIVSNENEYRKNGFNKIKEKVISKTIHFGNDSLDIAKRILNENIHCNELISKKWILSVSDNMMQNLDSINLRTLYCIIYTYKALFNEIRRSNIDKDVKRQAIMTGYVSIFTLTDAIKRNKITDYSNILNVFDKKYFNIRISLGFANNIEKDKKIVDYKSKQLNEFYLYNKFFNNSSIDFQKSIFYDKNIYDLVFSDEFNLNDYVLNISKNFSYASGMDRIYQKLINNYRYMTDNELKNLENELINSIKIQYKDININDLILFYDLLFSFYDFHLLLIDNSYNKLSQLSKLVLKLIQQMPLNSAKYSTCPFTLYTFHDKDLKSKIINAYHDRHSDYLLCIDRKGIYNIFNRIPLYGFPILFTTNSLFKLLLSSKKYKREILKNPKAVMGLQGYLNVKLIKTLNSYHYHYIELKYIDNFIKFLKDAKLKTHSHINEYNLNALLITTKNTKRELIKQKE